MANGLPSPLYAFFFQGYDIELHWLPAESAGWQKFAPWNGSWHGPEKVVAKKLLCEA